MSEFYKAKILNSDLKVFKNDSLKSIGMKEGNNIDRYDR